MKYSLNITTKEDGTPTGVTIWFHVPETETDSEQITVMGLGRNGHTNPFHPIEDKVKSDAFERARQTAIAVFEAVKGGARASEDDPK